MYEKKHYSNLCSAEEKSQVWNKTVWNNETGVLSNESMHRSKADQLFLQKLKIKSTETCSLTIDISSSGWINLLVALVVVRVAGLLVTGVPGLATVLLVLAAAVAEDWV